MNVTKLGTNVRLRSTVSVNLSAADWALYTSAYSRVIIEKVANFLNGRFNYCYNIGMTEAELKERMASLMDSMATYGASDTEPRAILEDLCRKVYK